MKKQHIILKKADLKKIESMLSKGSLKSREYKRATGLIALNVSIQGLLPKNCSKKKY